MNYLRTFCKASWENYYRIGEIEGMFMYTNFRDDMVFPHDSIFYIMGGKPYGKYSLWYCDSKLKLSNISSFREIFKGDYMERTEAVKLEKAITHFANGGNLWSYTGTKWIEQRVVQLGDLSHDICNIIEDDFFEARRAHARGKPIEVSDDMGVCDGSDEWIVTDCPSWNSKYFYRPKRKRWHDNIPREGILCWVSGKCVEKTIARMIVYKRVDHSYGDILGDVWDKAEPVKPEELWKGVD